MEILDGKWLSSTIREELKEKVDQLEGVRLPKLVVVLVGDDPASHTYVNAKEKACKDVGFISQVHRLSVDTTNEELLALIKSLNEDESVDGILVQMPIPKHLDSKAVILAIDPEKDVHIDEICRRADLIVAAVGVPHFVKKDWVKNGAIVVDVGIHRTDDNKIIGDVVAEVMEIASYMTPVPKGVGPMTIAMLLSNTFDAYQQHMKG